MRNKSDSNPINLLLVVPTRNRADLARLAIQSLLKQRQPNCQILVSDNSTEEIESQRLSEFCKEQGQVLHCVRPPQPMPMSTHWQWAFEQAKQITGVTHITYVTDRTLFKRGGLTELLRLTQKHPDKLLAYNHDRIIDYRVPIVLEQVGWSGKLSSITSADMLAWYAHANWHSALPRMMNCIVPLKNLNVIGKRFGSVFDSFSPDICFGFRYLACYDEFLYYDKAPIFHHALGRSNGASHGRGVATKDSVDFLNTLSDQPVELLTPVPKARTVMNWVLHEYNLVREAVANDQFPEINLSAYFSKIGEERDWMEDPAIKEEISALLESALADRDIDISTNEQSYHAPTVPPLIFNRARKFATQAAALAYAETRYRSRGSRQSFSELVNKGRYRLKLRTRAKRLVASLKGRSEPLNRAEGKS